MPRLSSYSQTPRDPFVISEAAERAIKRLDIHHSNLLRSPHLNISLHPFHIYVDDQFYAAFSNRLCAELSATWLANELKSNLHIPQPEADKKVTIINQITSTTYIKIGGSWI